MRKNRSKLFIVAVLLLGSLCIRLGFWQLSRREARIARNESIEQLLSFSPAGLPGETNSLEQWEYRRVNIRGIFDADESIVLRNRAYLDQPGVHLISPMIIEETGTAILVDRGWIPVTQFLAEEIAAYAGSGDRAITGILRLSDPEPTFALLADPTLAPGEDHLKEWRVLNVQRIQEQIPYTLFPMYLQMTEPNPPPGSYPVPNPETDLSDGPHLSYAIQWFSFGVVAFVGSFLWWRHKA
ncbi:MAG: SURF1 family protein [Chloroflexi bacterium]|nr:SURF1 family protein [Chloroflexota bacterium]